MRPLPEPTIARIENAVAFMNYVVERYGERYAPVRDSLIVDLEARQRRLPSPGRSMPKRPRPLPDRTEVTDDTPLHMETAARLAFPDGVITGNALRKAAARGHLEYERLGGRIVTTLRFIREWRERNRHPAKVGISLEGPVPLSEEHRTASVAAAYRAIAELLTKPVTEKRGDAVQAKAAALEARHRSLKAKQRIRGHDGRQKDEPKPE